MSRVGAHDRGGSLRLLGGGLVLCLLFANVLSCEDPLQHSRIDALGPEAPGVSPGPLHRAGQPCLTCHDGTGPGEPELSVAGTIYQTPGASSPPMVGATVTIYDATQSADGGTPHTAVTNAAGNFYFTREAWSPAYPLHDISVSLPNLPAPTKMHTTIGRDGSCGVCHYEPPGRASPGRIYVVLEPGDLPQP